MDVIWHVALAAVTATAGFGLFMRGMSVLSDGSQHPESARYGRLFVIVGAALAGFVLFKAFGG